VATSPIDLSAGLVPNTAAPQGGIDLSAGLVPKPTDTRNDIQKSFDANTSYSPNDPLLKKVLAGTAHAIGAPFIHPIDTASGVLNSMDLSNAIGPNAPAPKPWADVRKELPYQAGEVLGGTALGEAAGGAVRAASPAVSDATSTALAKAQAIGGKLVPSLVDGPPESLITRAIKPGKNNVNWNADVQKALPLMKSAEQQLGRPIQGVDDALAAADLAKKQVWQQYQQRLGPAAARGAVIDGNQIADAMVSSIDKRTALQNPGLVQRVQQVADTYRRPLSLGDAEDFLQSTNKDLNTYYAKNKVGQNVALNDPDIASTVAEGNALRSALYSKLDQLTGPGAAQLKQAYGSLTNIEKELYGRQLVAARQNPESLPEQMGTIRGAGKILKGVATFDPGDVLEGAQNIAVSRALKARNSSDAMISRAFEKAQPATPFPMPKASAPIAGALPASTGGPIELPYVPEMSGGEQLAALMQLLRKSQPIALPAQATPIRLPPPQ